MSDTMELYQFYCKKLLDDGYALDELNNYDNFRSIFTEIEFKRIMNDKQNRKNKRYRTRNKFLEILRIANELKDNSNMNVVFGTITLDNEHLALKEDTYMRKIHKWLKEHFVIALLNKDYGSKNEREHYHFIGLTIEEIESKNILSKKGYEIFELKNKNYTMGFEPTLCLIDLSKDDISKTTNYLLKLNNHSNKITSRNRLRVVQSYQYDYLYLKYRIGPTKAEKRHKKDIKIVV